MTDRQDDKVDKDGVPISEAHKAIYDHLGECRDDIVGHIDQKINRHVENRHDSLIELGAPVSVVFDGHSPDEVFTKLVAMSDQFDELANAVLGTPKSSFLGGGRVRDGLVAKNDELFQKFGNGQAVPAKLTEKTIEDIVSRLMVRPKRKFTAAQWAFFGVAVATLGTVLVQILQILWDIRRDVG
jgi:hypothetical protein